VLETMVPKGETWQNGKSLTVTSGVSLVICMHA